jgi:hypothetical protein
MQTILTQVEMQTTPITQVITQAITQAMPIEIQVITPIMLRIILLEQAVMQVEQDAMIQIQEIQTQTDSEI